MESVADTLQWTFIVGAAPWWDPESLGDTMQQPFTVGAASDSLIVFLIELVV